MRKILVTGFDPFGSATVNAAWEAVKRLPDCVGDYALCKLQIPTIFGAAASAVLEKADQFHPDVILCIGQAGGRAAITPERIAVNIRDARIPDNAGNQPRGTFVVDDAPAAYFSTVSAENIAAQICALNLPSTVSNSAGAFVCNDTMYKLLYHYAGSNVRVGFVHVPYLPEQGSPSLPLEDIVRALIAAIKAC